MTVFVLYRLLLLSLTILVIITRMVSDNNSCKRDINKLLLLLLIVCIIIGAESDASQRSRRFLDLASMNFHCGDFADFVAFKGQLGVVMWPLNISN